MDITGIALLSLTLVLLGFFSVHMYQRMQRTRILQMPGGLRFEAYDFSVQVQRREQEVRVRCARGVLAAAADDASQEQAAAASAAVPRPAEHSFAAVGLAVELRDSEAKGYTNIVMRGADGTQLSIVRVSSSVAASFQYFYLQVRLWIDKLEQRLERERLEQLRSEEATAQLQRDADLLAQLTEGRAPNAALTDEEREAMAAAQITQWRAAAGFSGQHSLHHTDPKGRVVWFVDLADDGRITLHADKRTVHSTLRGAAIEAVFGELEVGVRDAYWSEDNPQLSTMRVLKGRNAAERLAWRERLEILRNSLDEEQLPEQVPFL
jgi:hypothetical protein